VEGDCHAHYYRLHFISTHSTHPFRIPIVRRFLLPHSLALSTHHHPRLPPTPAITILTRQRMFLLRSYGWCGNTEKRKAEAERIRQKYADRIPVSPLLFRSSVIFHHGRLIERISRWELTLLFVGDLREGGEERHPYYRQEEVPRPSGLSQLRHHELC